MEIVYGLGGGGGVLLSVGFGDGRIILDSRKPQNSPTPPPSSLYSSPGVRSVAPSGRGVGVPAKPDLLSSQEDLDVDFQRTDRVFELEFVQHGRVQDAEDADHLFLAREVEMDSRCVAGEVCRIWFGSVSVRRSKLFS